MSSQRVEVLCSEINETGGRRALQKLVLEAPLMIENREQSDANKDAVDLYWLAFLLTGRRDISIDIAVDSAVSQDAANQFFAAWMSAWSRRIVIAKSLTAIRDELAESAHRTDLACVHQSAAPTRKLSLRPDATKTQAEEALLAIHVFSRVAVLLLSFEGVRMADAATLLDVDAVLVRKGQAIGLRGFTANLVNEKSRAVPGFSRRWL